MASESHINYKKSKGEKLYLGIDLGGTNIQAGVYSSKEKLISRSRKKTKAIEGLDTVMSRIVSTADNAIKAAGVSRGDITALGIGAPGTVDADQGVVRLAVNLRWENVPLAKLLSKAMDMPVCVDNDCNAGTWAEYCVGAGRDYDDLLGVLIGTGIGGGLVLDGKLFRGHNFTAGEIGHTIIHADAPLGRRTFENAASRTNVVNLLRQLILGNRQSVITELTESNLDAIRSKILAKAFDAGDELTHTVLRHAANYVGIAVANSVTMLSLPAVVIGGGLMEALDETWLGWVRESFVEHVFPPELSGCKILESTLGDDANVIGAAILACESDAIARDSIHMHGQYFI